MIFNAEMVRAILDGRKTQTRRIMKPQPANDIALSTFPNAEACGWISSLAHKFGSTTAHFCPFGKPGDRIWVRETFQGPLVSEDLFEEYRAYPEKFEKPQYCEYAANGGATPEYCDLDDNLRHGWRPSIHMPRWASRISLEITGVRVERLNQISDAESSEEGCSIADMESGESLSDVFARLWSSIYGQESWLANPWVWVIDFKRVDGEAV